MKASEFVVKDSGNRDQFDGGAVRDTEEGKPRYDLISPWALTRLAYHMAKGAKKYGDRNWEKGMPRSRLFSSALRHLMQALIAADEPGDPWDVPRMCRGDDEDTEDHLSAAVFNLLAIIHFEEVGYPRAIDTTNTR
jgi:hypothetical protein